MNNEDKLIPIFSLAKLVQHLDLLLIIQFVHIHDTFPLLTGQCYLRSKIIFLFMLWTLQFALQVVKNYYNNNTKTSTVLCFKFY